MPNLVTARLFLEDSTKGLGESRETVGSLLLNEGFDRPFWAAEATRTAKVIPNSPETILVDGLVLLFEEFAGHIPSGELLELRSSAAKRLDEAGFIELYRAAALDFLASITNQLEVSLVAYPTSSVLRQLDDLHAIEQTVNLFLRT